MAISQSASERMKELQAKCVKDVNLTKARNGEHFDFMFDMKSMISDTKATLLHMEGLWEEFKKAFEIEDEAYKLIKGFEYTPTVKNLDVERKAAYMCVINIVRACQKSANSETKRVATHLMYVLKPFVGVYKKTFTERSAVITNMVDELQSPANAAALTLLNITAEVAQLKTKNEIFKEIFMERADEKEKYAAIEKMKTVRPQINSLFKMIRNQINSEFITNETASAPDEQVKNMLLILMPAMNARELELRNLVQARAARARTKAIERKAEEAIALKELAKRRAEEAAQAAFAATRAALAAEAAKVAAEKAAKEAEEAAKKAEQEA